MFAGLINCCCADNSNPNELLNTSSIGTYSTTEEKATDEAPSSVFVHQEIATKSSPRQEEPSSARSLTPEEKEAEKARLQQLVNSFAKKAVRGCPCTYLKESTGERLNTQYRIDKSLEYLIVVSDQDANRAEVTCPISSIEDIYSLVEDGAECFPTEVVSKLSSEEQSLLLMVVYRGGQSKMFRFCLLEQTASSRDIFLECLRILCIYAQAGNSQPVPAA
mmetsp:Transcript_49940/g.79024  ORF Transcript_49940/g.79024 Transcript_49940/m.79024 type:complete len:220 (-) Transcript_49940:140-799(-)